ncbi:hypothetical protein [Micromonospora maritima]|uniref:hypothetical protein n=1 Tax=Micromonospora maritima TaxID=986711 RepID=UPI00157BE043|nr:hypothetical protein [Micromonospora maritima]
MGDEPRRWRMHAGKVERPIEGRPFLNFGDPRTVRFNGREPVPVEVAEDPEGTYWGWIRKEAGRADCDGEPILIQPHFGMFSMQFHCGAEKEQEWGRGEIVRLSVREVTD